MHAKQILLIVLLLLISPVSRAHAQEEFTPIVAWDKQFFPSFAIATAALKTDSTENPEHFLGDRNGLLGVSLQAPTDDASVHVSIECPPFAGASRFVGKLPKAGTEYTVFPKMNYDYRALSQCSQATPVNVIFRVQWDGEPVLEKTVTMIVRPINDCPLKVQVGDQLIDRSLTFATFVNEQHPFTDKLLREALDIGVVDQFDGYQGKSDEAVLRQVYAIWDLLVARDVRYSSITTTASDSEQILSQNVRLLEETINNQQANCVDGSVLFVSLLRRIDIESFLVLVPGHCYVGFFLDRERTKIICLETTLLGSVVDEPEALATRLEAAVDEELRDEYSWPSYVRAIEMGTNRFSESQSKFADSQETEYRVIDIAAARKLGILPLPFRGNVDFLAFDHSEYSRFADSSDDESDESDESDEETGEEDEESEWSDEEYDSSDEESDWSDEE